MQRDRSDEPVRSGPTRKKRVIASAGTVRLLLRRFRHERLGQHSPNAVAVLPPDYDSANAGDRGEREHDRHRLSPSLATKRMSGSAPTVKRGMAIRIT